ncbi:MAG: NAD(+) synthase, partial [Deltaproteobacteria bacterium]|nr:NAD(+) synthase [Deltaproteobacteria bacterium]
MKQFFNLYKHGFIKTAVCIPEIRVADPAFNAARTIELAQKAAKEGALFSLFPELGISAYSNEDLFHQDALLEGTLRALETILDKTKNINMIMAVGAPLRIDSLLFNCGLVLYKGKILGIGVKSYLPNYREFYEGRQFSPAEEIISKTIDLGGQDDIPFGADLIFEAKNIKNFSLFLEICEDVWVSIPPSSFAALAGATVIANLSASNITVGKAEYRSSLVMNQSARLLAAYLYAGSGPGESTTDLAWDGHAMICENGTLLAESERFSQEEQIISADIDLDRLVQDRMRMTGFGQNARTHRDTVARFRKIPFSVEIPKKKLLLTRE